MMNKKYVIGMIGAGAILIGLAGVYGISVIKSNNEEESSSVQETTIMQPKPVTQKELAERTLFDVGEAAEVNGLVWKVTDVSLLEDYNSLDEYYKKRPEMYNPQDFLSLYPGSFPAEERWIVLKYTITNDSAESKSIYPWNLEFYDRAEDKTFDMWYGNYTVDGRCEGMEVLSREIALKAVEIPAGTTMEFEYVRQYDTYSSPIYDLYIGLNNASNVMINMGAAGDVKVCLNIAPKLQQAAFTDVDLSAEEARDIPALKAQQWTNMEMKAYQEKGYPLLSNKEGVQSFETEEVVEMGYEFVFHTYSSQLTGAKVVDWANMPADFAKRDALKNMAARYKEKYGVEENQLKILLLDIKYKADLSDEVPSESSAIDCEFYEMSYLFTRDNAGKRWVFGTMDDWMVTTNSVNSSRIGHINIERMHSYDTVTVTGAYILPPEIYEKETALYFCGGDLREGNYNGEPVAEIPLK